MRKSLLYFLWLTLGFFGAHHFYLGRHRHGFVWLCTFGGFFIGWLHDFSVMDRYVKESIGDENYFKQKYDRYLRGLKPNSSWFRMTGQTLMGVVFAFVYRSAIPEDSLEKSQKDKETYDWLMLWLTYGTPVALAAGIHLVGNIGLQHTRFKYCFWPAVLVSLALSIEEYTWYVSAIVSYVANNYGKCWSFPDSPILDKLESATAESNSTENSNSCVPVLQDTSVKAMRCDMEKTKVSKHSKSNSNGTEVKSEVIGKPKFLRKQKSSKKMVFITVNVHIYIYCTLLFLGIWHNAYVTMDDGEKVRVRDAVNHFFESPAWQQMMDTFRQLYDFYRIHGLGRLYKEFIAALDPEGESNAYKVLELKQGASDTEIRARCRLLSRKHHPDKVRDLELKAEAQKKFISVQQACDILDKVRKRRNRNARTDL